jgi:hypothetical protein
MKPEFVKSFILGGKAVFTAVSKVTGKHITFRVKRINDPYTEKYFVMVRTHAGWEYQFMLKKNSIEYVLTSRETEKLFTVYAKAFKFIVNNYLNAYNPCENLVIKHEGKCCKCGRPLTDPVSIEYGMGTKCRNSEKLINIR